MLTSRKQDDLRPWQMNIRCSKRSSSLQETDSFPLGQYSHLRETDIRSYNPDQTLIVICPCCMDFPFNPFPNENILDFWKLKKFADDNFKFDENGRNVSKWVENTVGKGEIAHYEQFLLFQQCFQKTYTADT